MDKKVFCIECNKYYENIESFNEEHNKIAYQVMNVKHNPLFQDNCLSYISFILSDTSKINEKLDKQNKQIEQISSEMDYYKDAIEHDVTFECNINIKNIKNKIDGICLLHFLPKSIQFRIEYKGEIDFNQKKEIEIEILFPFKKSELKFSTIEKLQGCTSNQKVLNISEQETNIFNAYSSSIIQNNYMTSIKLLRNYFAKGYFEQKKIDISINGILTFTNFKYYFNLPFILYNINYKKFLFYENNKWSFIDNCLTESGNIQKGCIVCLETTKNPDEILIKNDYKYLSNKNGLATTDKNEAIFNFTFFNKYYGIIKIYKDKKYLSCNIETGLIELSDVENNFIFSNI